MNKTLATTALAAVLALAALAAVVGSARATYPGATNGRIAFGINVDGNTDVYTARPTGRTCAASRPTRASTPAPPTRRTAGGSPTARARAAALSRCGR